MELGNVGIVGAGNSARALAAYLSRHGANVTMFARRPEMLNDIRKQGGVNASGLITGFCPISAVVDTRAELTKRANVIFIATVATAYEDVAEALAPYLTDNHSLILFSGKLGGCLAVERRLEACGAKASPVIETDSLFACRTHDDGAIWIRGFKNWTLYSCPRYTQTMEYGRLVKRFFPNLEPARNLIERGVTDFGAHAHAVITLANLSKIDRKESFLFYYEGLSERTVVLLEAMEREMKAVAGAYGAQVLPMADLLNRYYGCNTDSLLSAMRTVPNYQYSYGPDTLNHRYLKEDVACTLMPLQQLARKANVATPMIDGVIGITTVLMGEEIQHHARSLTTFGWNDLSQGEITEWLHQ